MNTQHIASKLAEKYKLPKAYKYDLFLREFDSKVELVGLVNDPTYNINDFQGREMLFPKRWIAIQVFDYDEAIPK